MTSRGGGRIVWESDTLSPGISGLTEAIDKAVGAVMLYEAPHVQDYMRSNAPWTDRSGNARGGLFAQPYGDNLKRGIVAYHTMPYGIWLEVRWSGRYQIIVPTIQVMGPKVMEGLSGLLNKMGVFR